MCVHVRALAWLKVTHATMYMLRERDRESASQEELYVVAGILRHSQLSELRHRASILL